MLGVLAQLVGTMESGSYDTWLKRSTVNFTAQITSSVAPNLLQVGWEWLDGDEDEEKGHNQKSYPSRLCMHASASLLIVTL